MEIMIEYPFSVILNLGKNATAARFDIPLLIAAYLRIKIFSMLNRLLLILFCFLISTQIQAQMSNKEIESSIERLNKAMITPDKSTLENITAEELSYGHSTGVVQNKSEYIKDILS